MPRRLNFAETDRLEMSGLYLPHSGCIRVCMYVHMYMYVYMDMCVYVYVYVYV